MVFSCRIGPQSVVPRLAYGRTHHAMAHQRVCRVLPRCPHRPPRAQGRAVARRTPGRLSAAHRRVSCSSWPGDRKTGAAEAHSAPPGSQPGKRFALEPHPCPRHAASGRRSSRPGCLEKWSAGSFANGSRVEVACSAGHADGPSQRFAQRPALEGTLQTPVGAPHEHCILHRRGNVFGGRRLWGQDHLSAMRGEQLRHGLRMLEVRSAALRAPCSPYRMAWRRPAICAWRHSPIDWVSGSPPNPRRQSGSREPCGFMAGTVDALLWPAHCSCLPHVRRSKAPRSRSHLSDVEPHLRLLPLFVRAGSDPGNAGMGSDGVQCLPEPDGAAERAWPGPDPAPGPRIGAAPVLAWKPVHPVRTFHTPLLSTGAPGSGRGRFSTASDAAGVPSLTPGRGNARISAGLRIRPSSHRRDTGCISALAACTRILSFWPHRYISPHQRRSHAGHQGTERSLHDHAHD